MRTILTLLAALVFVSAQAQQNSGAAPARQAPSAAPSPQQLEPAVDTTATTTPDAAPARAAAAAPGALTPKADRSSTAGSAARAASGAAAAADGARESAKAGTHGPKGPDRVELETTEITGNRELPKVLYIVPWKRSDIGDLVGKPANSLLDEVLQPIDRDVFLRENRYYDALKPGAAAPKAGVVPGSGGKP